MKCLQFCNRGKSVGAGLVLSIDTDFVYRLTVVLGGNLHHIIYVHNNG